VLQAPFDSTLVYNGDTLYYNFGYIHNLSTTNIRVNSPEALGIPGQSRSTFLFTDNNEYYNFGTMSYSNNYNHFKINKAVFYQLQNVIENYTTSINKAKNTEQQITISPNPLSTSTTIKTKVMLTNAIFYLDNALGKNVIQLENINGNTILLNRKSLVNGLYFYRIINTNNVPIANGKLMITD